MEIQRTETTAPAADPGGGPGMVLASLRSGLNCVSRPSFLPATSCFPFGDQLTQVMPSAGGTVQQSGAFPASLASTM